MSAYERLMAKADEAVARANALAHDIATSSGSARIGMRAIERDNVSLGVFIQIVIVLGSLGWVLGVAVTMRHFQ